VKLGLLKCDPRPFEAMYAAWLPDVEWVVYDVFDGRLPANANECEGWVGTGSRYSVYEDQPWIRAYADLVRDYHAGAVPFVGICFGHQMIGHALGGLVARSEGGWCVGIQQFAISRTAPWMTPPLAEFGVVMSCQDQVRVPPPGATILAGNATCPVGMLQVGRMLGIQGHPEYTPDYSEELMLSRLDRIGEARVRSAQTTLNNPRHSEELGRWVKNFLMGRP
jgi:GMP synthase-like glutamine amidotransferase